MTSKRVLLVALLLLPASARAEQQGASWVDQKCSIYQAAWERAVAAQDGTQINYAFIAANENFIASGCTEERTACPRSSVELEVANTLSLAMMNAGAASTFLPFRCPRETVDGGWTGPGL